MTTQAVIPGRVADAGGWIPRRPVCQRTPRGLTPAQAAEVSRIMARHGPVRVERVHSPNTFRATGAIIVHVRDDHGHSVPLVALSRLGRTIPRLTPDTALRGPV
jgi:hypothetical protein